MDDNFSSLPLTEIEAKARAKALARAYRAIMAWPDPKERLAKLDADVTSGESPVICSTDVSEGSAVFMADSSNFVDEIGVESR